MMCRNKVAAVAVTTAIIALASVPAAAEGVVAGTTITNTATIDFRVGGIDQTEVLASDSFVVDRKISVAALPVPAATVTVSPGQTRAFSTFEVSTASNAVLDLALSVAQPAGGAGPFGGTDTFNVTNAEIYFDTNNNAVWDAGDTLITYLDEVAPDAVARVFVVADVPLADRVNGDVAVVTLTIQAREGGTAGSQGAVVTQTSGPDTANVDTVFADLAGATDAARDGLFSVSGSYTVFAASLSVNKTSRVISDPVNGVTDPKAIPGAVIEYCIAVSNAASTATANNIVVTDVVPGQLNFDAAFGIRINGTVDGSAVCLADGAAGGSFAGGTSTVTAPLNDIAASQTRTAYFRATIN